MSGIKIALAAQLTVAASHLLDVLAVSHRMPFEPEDDCPIRPETIEAFWGEDVHAAQLAMNAQAAYVRAADQPTHAAIVAAMDACSAALHAMSFTDQFQW